MSKSKRKTVVRGKVKPSLRTTMAKRKAKMKRNPRSPRGVWFFEYDGQKYYLGNPDMADFHAQYRGNRPQNTEGDGLWALTFGQIGATPVLIWASSLESAIEEGLIWKFELDPDFFTSFAEVWKEMKEEIEREGKGPATDELIQTWIDDSEWRMSEQGYYDTHDLNYWGIPNGGTSKELYEQAFIESIAEDDERMEDFIEEQAERNPKRRKRKATKRKSTRRKNPEMGFFEEFELSEEVSGRDMRRIARKTTEDLMTPGDSHYMSAPFIQKFKQSTLHVERSNENVARMMDETGTSARDLIRLFSSVNWDDVAAAWEAVDFIDSPGDAKKRDDAIYEALDAADLAEEWREHYGFPPPVRIVNPKKRKTVARGKVKPSLGRTMARRKAKMEKNPSLGAEIKGIRRRRAKREAKEMVTEAKVAKEVRSKKVRRTLANLNPSSPPVDTEHSLGMADERWNQFEEAYDRFSVSGDCEDLVDAYTAARMAELHYRYAKVRHGDGGRGYGPAANEAVGLLRQIKEVCKK
jgi:hypothetical protein